MYFYVFLPNLSQLIPGITTIILTVTIRAFIRVPRHPLSFSFDYLLRPTFIFIINTVSIVIIITEEKNREVKVKEKNLKEIDIEVTKVIVRFVNA